MLGKRNLLLAGIAALLVAAGLALYFFTARGSTSPADLVAYLPPAKAPLLYVNVDGLRRAGVLELLAGSGIAEEEEYKRFVADSGFDYRKDLDAALVSFQDSAKLFVLVGRFDWKALSAYAEKQGGACQNGLCRMPGSRADRNISFYSLRRNVLALAVDPDNWAASLIAPRKVAELPNFPAEPIWLTLPASAIRKDGLPPGTRSFASALEGAENLTFALGADAADYALNLRVECRKPEEAGALAAQLRGATEMLRSLIAREKQTPNPADLSGILTSGQFRQDGLRVYGRWPLKRAFLENIAGGAR